MTKFKYNIGKSISQCEEVRIKINNYKNLVSQSYINTKSIANSWNDVASETFLKKVVIDEGASNQIINSLEKYQNNIEYFNNELGSIFSGKGYSIENLDIDYDSTYVSYANSEMEQLKNYVRKAQIAFEQCVVPADFEHLDDLNTVFNNLYNSIEMQANYVSNEVNDINNKIQGLIQTSKEKNNSVEFVSIDGKIIQVNAATVAVVPKINKTFVKNNVAEISGKNIEVDKKNINLENAETITISGTNYETNNNFNVKLNMVEEPTIDENLTINSNIEEIKLNEKENIDINSKVFNTIQNNNLNLEKASEMEIIGQAKETSIPSIELQTKDESNFSFNEIKNANLNMNLNLEKVNNETINIESTTINSNIQNINLENKTSDISINNQSIQANMGNLNLENKSSDSFDVSANVGLNQTNVNLEKAVNVTAQDILDNNV